MHVKAAKMPRKSGRRGGRAPIISRYVTYLTVELFPGDDRAAARVDGELVGRREARLEEIDKRVVLRCPVSVFRHHHADPSSGRLVLGDVEAIDDRR